MGALILLAVRVYRRFTKLSDYNNYKQITDPGIDSTTKSQQVGREPGNSSDNPSRSSTPYPGGRGSWSALFDTLHQKEGPTSINSGQKAPRHMDRIPSPSSANSLQHAYNVNLLQAPNETKSSDNDDNGDGDEHEEGIKISGRSLLTMQNIPPRGLVNYGNMCFLNAILQSLIHCPPLANLFLKLRRRLKFLSFDEAAFLKSIDEIFLAHEDSISDMTSGGARSNTIVPQMLYDCLKSKSIGDAFQGAQEDAQEFLTFLLDQLHEELLACQDKLLWHFHSGIEDRESASSGEWLEMGPKQRVFKARSMELSASPISFLFFGRYRSLVKRHRAKDSITSEPFHCISVDASPEALRGGSKLEDALLHLVAPEHIEDRIIKQISIETEPAVLIIQLKRFIYNPQSQRVEKTGNFISYPETLSLDKPIIYRDTAHPSQYRLFSVIYHHGRSADGGHYTCHVRQTLNPDDLWLFFDDTAFHTDPLDVVLASKGQNQTAYLLIYVKIRERKPKK